MIVPPRVPEFAAFILAPKVELKCIILHMTEMCMENFRWNSLCGTVIVLVQHSPRQPSRILRSRPIGKRRKIETMPSKR
jgi:hypothetical protein